jgi:hypothetical protein
MATLSVGAYLWGGRHGFFIVLERSVPPDLVGVAQLRVSGNYSLLVCSKCTLNNVAGMGLYSVRLMPSLCVRLIRIRPNQTLGNYNL